MIFEACSFGGGDASEERPRVSRSVVAFLRPQSTASPSRSSSGDALHSPWRGLALRRKAVGPSYSTKPAFSQPPVRLPSRGQKLKS